MNETSKLRWRCRRGMRELDVVLLKYLEHAYPAASQAEKDAFRRCLELQDPEILDLLTGRQTPGDEALASVVEKIRTTPDSAHH